MARNALGVRAFLMKTGRPPKPLFERFVEKLQLDEQTGCWLWRGAITSSGYALFTIERRGICAHRVAYGLFVTWPEEGIDVHHRCRNRRCVNPAHLEHAPRNQHARFHCDERFACRNGHPYKDGHFYVSKADG